MSVLSVFCKGEFIRTAVGNQATLGDVLNFVQNGRISYICTVLGVDYLISDAHLQGTVAEFREFVRNIDPNSTTVSILVTVEF